MILHKKLKLYNTLIICLLLLSVKICARQNNFSEDYSTYLPEVHAFYKASGGFPNVSITPDLIKMVRTMMGKPQQTVLKPSTQSIDGPYGKIGLRIFKPQKIEAVYLDIHGGGQLWGSAMSDDSLNDLMARTCNMAVISVDYHLAPEYPFPAQITDCNATAKWLLQNAKANFGTDKLFIGGGSAGAQLTATTILYIRDSLHAADKISGVVLANDIFDLGGMPSYRNATDSTPGLNKHALREIMEYVFGKFTMEQKQSPEYSPLYANLKKSAACVFSLRHG